MYSIMLLKYRFGFVCYERSDGNMKKRSELFFATSGTGNIFF